MSINKAPSSEASLQRRILGHLARMPGVFAWRQNTGAARTANGMIRFGIPGQADITGVILHPFGFGVRLEIEVKAKRGRAREDQAKFGAKITELGGVYIIARTLDEALAPVRKVLAGEHP